MFNSGFNGERSFHQLAISSSCHSANFQLHELDVLSAWNFHILTICHSINFQLILFVFHHFCNFISLPFHLSTWCFINPQKVFYFLNENSQQHVLHYFKSKDASEANFYIPGSILTTLHFLRILRMGLICSRVTLH